MANVRKIVYYRVSIVKLVLFVPKRMEVVTFCQLFYKKRDLDSLNAIFLFQFIIKSSILLCSSKDVYSNIAEIDDLSKVMFNFELKHNISV